MADSTIKSVVYGCESVGRAGGRLGGLGGISDCGLRISDSNGEGSPGTILSPAMGQNGLRRFAVSRYSSCDFRDPFEGDRDVRGWDGFHFVAAVGAKCGGKFARKVAKEQRAPRIRDAGGSMRDWFAEVDGHGNYVRSVNGPTSLAAD